MIMDFDNHDFGDHYHSNYWFEDFPLVEGMKTWKINDKKEDN